MELRHFRYFAAVARPLTDTGRLGVVRHIALRDLSFRINTTPGGFCAYSNEALSPRKDRNGFQKILALFCSDHSYR